MPSHQHQPAQMDTGLEHAQQRIDDQALVVKRLKAEGSDTRAAERLLTTYRELLALLKPHGQ